MTNGEAKIALPCLRCIRQRQTPALPDDKSGAQSVFQFGDQLLDSSRGHRQFYRRIAIAEMPRDSLKGAEGVQGRKPFRHKVSFSKLYAQIKWFSYQQ